MRRLTIAAGTAGLALVLCQSATPQAQSGAPAVTSVSGTVAHGQTITIAGSSFGAKSLAAPVVWENFDDSAASGIIPNGTPALGNQNNLRHAFAIANARVDFKADPRQFFEYDGPTAPKWFVQYWIKLAPNWHWGTTDTSGNDDGLANVKFFRLHPPGRPYTNVGYAYHGYGNTETKRFTENADEEGLPFNFASVMTPGVWHSLQFEYGENTGADRTDGHIRMWIDGQLRHSDDALITNASADGAASDKRPLLVSFWDSWPSSDAAVSNMYAYYTDFYIDRGWARVELGNAPTYNACTLREMQIPTAWSAGSISVRVNQGSFSNGQTAYLYVIDANGRVNASGHPVAAGSASTPDTSAPSVAVTAPAGGATVSATQTVTASASDNVGVAGVQFKLDGVNLGSEDTSAPYSTSWTTTSAANGSHALTALARDAAGNQATSAAVTVTVANSAPPPPAPAGGLVLSYTFDDGAGATASDGSGQNNHGTISGATWTSSGHAGGALVFDGINDRVSAVSSASLGLTTAMTLQAWVYPTAPGGTRTVIVKETAGGLAYSLYALENTAPVSWIRLAGSPSGHSATGTSALALNAWSHLAATFDGSTLRMFVNGAETGTRAAAGSLTASTGPLQIGGNAVWGEYFAGRIDDVRIYNRVRTAAEIAADGAGGAPPPPPPPPPAPPPAPDTTAPSVSISAPAPAATVAGITALTATASDNVGVAGVTFRVDGAAVGSEDVTAPYSVSWTTTAVANGAHTITAVARDAAGNQTVSSGRTVTVANKPRPPSNLRIVGRF